MSEVNPLHVRAGLMLAAYGAGHFSAPGTSAFKYISLGSEPAWSKLEQTLLENRLSFTQVGSLNDPFDISPIVIDNLSPAEKAEFIRGLKIADSSLDPEVLKVWNGERNL